MSRDERGPVRDRQISFSAPMVRALLDGRKRQTRRVLKPRGYRFYEHPISGWRWEHSTPSRGVVGMGSIGAGGADLVPYAVGDRLWCREAWRAPAMNDGVAPRDLPIGCARKFEADGEEVIGDGDDVVPFPIGAPGRYRHARFMPRWASRLTLLVSEVRVQRLQDITDAECVAEGIPLAHHPAVDPPVALPVVRHAHMGLISHYGYAFREMWDGLNRKRAPWEANPWVVALTFTVIRANIDAIQPGSVS